MDLDTIRFDVTSITNLAKPDGAHVHALELTMEDEKSSPDLVQVYANKCRKPGRYPLSATLIDEVNHYL